MATLINATTGQIIARNVNRANRLIERILGFIPWSRVSPDEGLWFDRCNAVHTVGMRSRIDVIFLDEKSRVLRIDRSVPRFRLAVTCPHARAVVELGEAPPEGRDLLTGDELALR